MLGLTIAAIAFLAACATGQSTLKRTEEWSCGWRVVSERPARSEDLPHAERHLFLAEPADGNDVPGPDSTRLVVKRTDHKASLYVRDLRTGSDRLLIPRGTRPRVSPDGRYVAFIYWKSLDSPWTLGIHDRKTGKRIEPRIGGHVSAFPKWSPDGNWLAVMEQPSGLGRKHLWALSVTDTSLFFVDSLDFLSDFEFDWSPNSGLLAIAKPESIDSNEEPTAADLWIYSTFRRTHCRVTSTVSDVEHRPMWVTDSTLLVESNRRENGRFVGEKRALLTIRGTP